MMGKLIGWIAYQADKLSSEFSPGVPFNPTAAGSVVFPKPELPKVLPLKNQILESICLNFSINAEILRKTLCLFFNELGLSGLILGKMLFNALPLSLACSRLREVEI